MMEQCVNMTSRLSRSQPNPGGDNPCAFRDRVEKYMGKLALQHTCRSGMVLENRYLVCELLEATEWDVLCAGYDLSVGARVVIRL